MDGPPTLPTAARDAILDWFAVAGRPLPFRATVDPYAIVVSEAMAQQTQAARAGEAWTRFMAVYPTVAALADATPAAVLRAWHGLGYNRRALNLWRAARRIVDQHGGTVPADVASLQALPGVGPYTARAVAAIAFALPVGAVDTNVRRVIGRIVAGGPGTLDRGALQAIADAAVPPDRPAAWTHAVMDLGAMVCTPRLPDCPGCPVRTWCRYGANDAAGLHHVADRHPRPRASSSFHDTTRWLRGRIVDHLRAASGNEWTVIHGPIGGHDREAVAAAVDALAREGLVELDGQAPDGGRRVRLPTA